MTITTKHFFGGAFCVILYVAMAAVREVFFALTLRQVNIYMLISLAFTPATIFFSLLQSHNVRKLAIKVKDSSRDLLLINITTAVAWFSFIFALRFIEPAIATSIITALGPVATLAIGSIMLCQNRIKRTEVACALGIVVSVALLAYVTMAGKSAVRIDSMNLVALGLGCAGLSGIASAANNVVAKRLASQGFNAAELMALRFYILIIGSTLFVVLSDVEVKMTFNQITNILAISLLGIIVPLYILQVGITKIDVNSIALVITIGPIITFAVQMLNGSFHASLYTFLGVCLTMTFVFVGIFRKFMEIKSASIEKSIQPAAVSQLAQHV